MNREEFAEEVDSHVDKKYCYDAILAAHDAAVAEAVKEWRKALSTLVGACAGQSAAYVPHSGTHDGRGYCGTEDPFTEDEDGDAPCRICIAVAAARAVLERTDASR